MEFGRVDPKELKKIDFSLPPDPKQTLALLKNSGKVNRPDIKIGCAKWGRKEWVGKLYPKGTKESDFLSQYGKRFNTIELNATFYKIYDKETVKKWVSMVGPDFKFCPKFYQGITHIRRLKNADELTTTFLDSIYTFGDHLGPCFLQLSDNFAPKSFPELEAYLKALPKDLELFVEVRHKDWFNPENSERLFGMLEKQKAGAVITDASGRRDCVHQHLTTPSTFIRFVGNGKHSTDYTRIDEWVLKLQSWFKKGLSSAYFYMHQHDELHSPEMCIYTIEKINSIMKLHLKAPEFIKENTLF